MCLSRSKVCDGFSHCPNGEDELDCPGTCSTIQNTYFSIGDNKKSDKSIIKEIIKCNEQLINWRYACDGSRIECESECNSCYSPKAFDCHMKSFPSTNKTSRRCIPRNMVSFCF